MGVGQPIVPRMYPGNPHMGKDRRNRGFSPLGRDPVMPHRFGFIAEIHRRGPQKNLELSTLIRCAVQADRLLDEADGSPVPAEVKRVARNLDANRRGFRQVAEHRVLSGQQGVVR
ncbi:MAG: hypothetical protein AAFY59_20040, partial [Pseudomonadota bacterium]